MATTESISTAEQLLQARDLGRCELVRGELVALPLSNFERGQIANRITLQLDRYVVEQASGAVTGAKTGFQIAHAPDTVRAPDVGFVQKSRVPEAPTPGYFPGAPDLAVEVLSPNDRAGEVLAKVQDWLTAGCEVVWVADPESRTITQYLADRTAVVFDEGATIDGGELLQGFVLSVADVFAR